MKSRETLLRELLKEYPRIAICGGPKTGKSTLSEKVTGRAIVHTDDFKHLAWAAVPDAVIREVSKHDSFVVEGVQAARCLRRGMQVDAVIYLDDPKAEQTNEQQSMSKAVNTVFTQWRQGNAGVHVESPDLAAAPPRRRA